MTRLSFSLFTFMLLLVNLSLSAQGERIKVYGTIQDQNTKQPIEFATVMLADKDSKAAITGTSTDERGAFEMTTKEKNFFIEISFIGFETKKITEFNISGSELNLGTILLANNSQQLDEVVVRAEKSQTEFKLDKRVFNVGKDLSSTGASALEVLNNVPSVNVSIEGDISLRGSQGVQILINGKPSVIASEQGNALGTITAEMIDRIEVITNPSAKYDAEGTSGIINIVIKKEERKGINGSISLNTGTPHNHSVGLSLNRRTERFNLFSQIGVGYRELPNDTRNINRDLNNNTDVLSTGEEFRNETFYNFILGTDYHINKYNILTLSGNFAYEVEDQPSRTDFQFIDATGAVTNEWFREEETEATNPKWQYELQYKKGFEDDEDHMLLFSALGTSFSKDQSSNFFNTTTAGSEVRGTQETRTNFEETEYTFKLDYTKPFNKKFSIETGAQYVIKDVSNDFAVDDWIDGEFVNNPDLTNIFEYDQKVLGVYGTGAYENDQWGLKLGLRLENTDLSTFLLNTQESNQQNFTNLFPSAHTSYKLTDNFSLQAGYSRRIFRPRLWDLNPFFNIRNNFSIRTGNPDLLPEFTDSYEISSIYIAGPASFNFSIYQRYTTDVVERVSTFENNVNIFKPYNIGTNRATGVEINGKYTVSKQFSINGDINYNYFNRKGELEGTNFDFSADQWTSKLTAKLKLPAGIDLEATGQYESRQQTVQSLISGNLFMDMGIRKKILKGRGVINFSARDLFASRIRESVTEQPTFYVYSWRQRGRFLTLGFSYGFGKGEAMEFSGQRRRR